MTQVGSTAWPHLLADLKAKRAALDQVIEIVERTFVLEEELASPAPAASAKRPYTRRGKPARKVKAVRGRPRAASVTPARERVLDLLRTRSPLKPRELAAQLKIDAWKVSYDTKPLIAEGLITVTGKTNTRAFAITEKGRLAVTTGAPAAPPREAIPASGNGHAAAAPTTDLTVDARATRP